MLPRRYVPPVLLASVVVIATSGLIYELLAGTIASYVLGDSVAQFSIVIGLYLFAMGVGSYLSKFLEDRLLERFVEIELAVALVGGASAPILFAVYTSLGAFRAALYLLVAIIGTLVGLEIPILIRLLKFRLELKELVARVLALDYVGALVASLMFPLLLVPKLGIHRTSLVFGILNALVALLATYSMPVSRAVRWRLRTQCAVVLGGLVFGVVVIDRGVARGETAYFGAPIVYSAQSPYQRIVLTQSPRTTRLFLNGNLQFSSDDEARYHEVLVHPAVGVLGREPRRVLVLGGGDGLAVRELLKYPSIERVLLVDLDPEVTHLFRTLPVATQLNRDALNDPRVEVRNEDAFTWIANSDEPAFDLAVVDFPDPSNYGLGKLYSLTFFRRLRERIGVQGAAVVQSTSPYFARQSFWTIATTMEEAGFAIAPMHCYVPSFGEWGFIVTGPPGRIRASASELRVGADKLRFLDSDLLVELRRFPRDMDRVDAPVNRLNDQPLVSIYTREWESWR
ncbi:MAG: polyamine aminopropyltransferase [Myxococcota bacterium]